MGLYGSCVAPRLIRHAMGAARLMPLRRQVAQAAVGRVVELGIGAGANLTLYGRDVVEVQGFDTARYLLEQARRTATWLPFPVLLFEQSAEHLPLASASVDTVVVTWSLCSIADPLGALREARRVLAPGGRLRFVEHGLSDQPGLAAWQRRVTPAWRRLAGGCRLDQRVDRLIERAGFTLERLEVGHLVPGPKLLTYHYAGVAAI